MSMRVFITVLLFSVLCSFASHRAIVDANVLNVRKTSSVNSAVIEKLPKETEVFVDTCSNGFCKIKYDSITGYASEKYLVIKQEQDSPKKRSEDAWGLLVFALICFVVAEFGFRKKIGCISAGAVVLALISIYVFLDESNIEGKYKLFLLFLVVVVVGYRNFKSRNPRERNNFANDLKDYLILLLKWLALPFEILNAFSDSVKKTDNTKSQAKKDMEKIEKKEVMYCKWHSNELNQDFYGMFAKYTSTSQINKIFECQYGKGSIRNSTCSKDCPSWYEIGEGKEVVYCKWHSNELNQDFYGMFAKYTSTSQINKTFERQYGKGSIRNSTCSKDCPSWYEIGEGKEVVYCKWHSNELNQDFYGMFAKYTSTSQINKTFERQYGKGSIRNSTCSKDCPNWYGA